MWSVDGEPVQQLSEVSFYCTGLLWHPSATGRAQGDVFVVGCTDGSFRLISRQGRVEKVEANAHEGAVTCVRWSRDGASLPTAGEDGLIKSWSRTGMFRANLAASQGTVHAMCSPPDITYHGAKGSVRHVES